MEAAAAPRVKRLMVPQLPLRTPSAAIGPPLAGSEVAPQPAGSPREVMERCDSPRVAQQYVPGGAGGEPPGTTLHLYEGCGRSRSRLVLSEKLIHDSRSFYPKRRQVCPVTLFQ